MNSETVNSTDLHAAYLKINRLGRELKNVQTNLEEIDQRIHAAVEEVGTRERDLDLAMRSGNAGSRQQAEAALSEARARAGELNGHRARVVRLRDSMQGEVSPTKLLGYQALAERTSAVRKSLVDAIRADAKIQQLLVDVFLSVACAIDAGVHPNGLSGWVRWEALIEEMFPLPPDHMLEAREPAFRKLHGIPLLADVGTQDV